jgi:3-hydroxyacyl-[acyl-carrier-protein] dehydratase
MRYVLIDRFLELERGARGRAVKCVTKGEPDVGDLGAFPPSLVLEALLQTGGVVTRSNVSPWARSAVGKVERAVFRGEARAGDRIILDVNVILSRPEGKLLEGVATVDGNVICKTSFLIVFLPPELTPPEPPEIRLHRRLVLESLGVSTEGE